MHFNFLGIWLLSEGRRSQWGQRSLSPQTNGTGSSDLVTPCASTLVAKNYLVCCLFFPQSWWKFPTIYAYFLYFLKLESQKEKLHLDGLSYFDVSNVFFSALTSPTSIWKLVLKVLQYQFRNKPHRGMYLVLPPKTVDNSLTVSLAKQKNRKFKACKP